MSGDGKSDLAPVRLVIDNGQLAEPMALPEDPPADAGERKRAPGRDDGSVRDYTPPDFSEEAVALFFSAGQHVGLRHVEAWGSWMIWDGQVWRRDADNVALDRARQVCRKVAEGCDNKRLAKDIAAKKTAANVLYLAKADRRQAAVVEQWDTDGWLLNTPAGVTDLRKELGNVRPHRAEDYMTKITAATPAGECPLWKKFLDRVTAGDLELQGYLQRLAGYCLTGSTREHAMFFLYGTGANGKSVFINTLSGIMGAYARPAPIETFTEAQGERHPTELAGLRGARMVTAAETEEGRKWAEAKIKALTGGDPIAARFMRQDFFEYVPTFKLVIAGNHKPHLRTVDEAVRRRFHLVPFAVTIPAEERDEQLADKLRAEWPGILAWMIEGAIDWGGMGLCPPEAVRAATDDYLRDQDVVQQFLEECCELGPFRNEATADLYEALQAWAAEAGLGIGKQRWFGRQLQGKGCHPDKGTGGVRTYVGLSLNPAARDRLAGWRRRRPSDQGNLSV